MQQHIQVKGRHIVANQDIRVQAVQAAEQVAQQGTLTSLQGQHAAAIALSQLTLVALLHCLLKPCTVQKPCLTIGCMLLLLCRLSSLWLPCFTACSNPAGRITQEVITIGVLLLPLHRFSSL